MDISPRSRHERKRYESNPVNIGVFQKLVSNIKFKKLAKVTTRAHILYGAWNTDKKANVAVKANPICVNSHITYRVDQF